jgi:hypothetical protein
MVTRDSKGRWRTKTISEKADFCNDNDVQYWPLADISFCVAHVCRSPKADICRKSKFLCKLCGHRYRPDEHTLRIAQLLTVRHSSISDHGVSDKTGADTISS